MIDKYEELKKIRAALDELDESKHRYFVSHLPAIPLRKQVIRIIKYMQSLMFEEYFQLDEATASDRDGRLEELFDLIKMQISAAFSFADKTGVVDTESIALELVAKLPQIKRALIKDVQAIYEGDPAAVSPEEVLLSYPGFYAISIYRIAHEFYLKKIPYLSRMMTEFAHEKTGIDIHAGATIGEYFCIDHGTGIVVGETATIGDRVKLYQGVTLGAKSFELDENGNPVKGIKRHPDIGNGCIIYAGATILGGNTKIGDGTVIGGNVWLTHSVGAGKVVYYGRENES